MLDAAAAKARAPGTLVAVITTGRVTPILATGRGGPIPTSLFEHVAINVRTAPSVITQMHALGWDRRAPGFYPGGSPRPLSTFRVWTA